MSDDQQYTADEQVTESERRANWRLRVIVLLVAVPTLVILYAIGASFFPRWWAHRIGAMSDGQFHKGISVGLLYGFAFTLIALIVLRQMFRKRFSWKVRGALLAVALLIESPNLLTLGIVLGSSKAAHAGQRTLDTDAPGFRGASLLGVIGAVALAAGAQYLWTSRKRTRRTVKELKARVREQDSAGQPDTDQSDQQADH